MAKQGTIKESQVWTPAWVAAGMASYALAARPNEVFDPALGSGNLWSAVRQQGFQGNLSGCELDFDCAAALGRFDGQVEWSDFLDCARENLPAVIANPPYMRHHILSAVQKVRWQAFVKEAFDLKIDGRAGLHVYFLLKSLSLLAPGGRLSFIVSADIAEGVFAEKMWQKIVEKFNLEIVFSFAATATPFPTADVHALLLCLRRPVKNEKVAAQFEWCRVGEPLKDFSSLIKHWMEAGNWLTTPGFAAQTRQISEAIVSGLSRTKKSECVAGSVAFSSLFKTVRGIATGDNEFFVASADVWRQRGIGKEFLIPCVGKVRDAKGSGVLDKNWLSNLKEGGQWLLNAPVDNELHSDALKRYFKEGESNGVHLKTLIATRNPWWKMEKRVVPSFLFAYLGRSKQRFILNKARVVPLTSYLCVYPKNELSEVDLMKWHAYLNSEEVIAGLSEVGKSYGGGAVKVEPRSLDKLSIRSDGVV